MALEVRQLGDAVGDLKRNRALEQARLQRIWRHLNDVTTGRQAGVYVPQRVTREFRMLVEQARFNVLELVVTTVAQNLFVEGFTRTNESGRAESIVDNADVWDRVWQPNRMDARQAGLWRAAITYGTSYAVVLPGTVGDEPVPEITPWSPRRLTALYADTINGEWPELAMIWLRQRTRDGKTVQVVELYDDAQVWTLELPEEGGPRVVKVEQHAGTVTPVVRFRNRFELDGSPGKVEPLIPLQQQLNQTTFALLMAQQYGAFRQRYVTGMEIQTDKDGNAKAPFNIAVDSMLQAENKDTKFGEFSQTDLGGYLESRDKTLLHVASIAQMPPHALVTGPGISNISAEALAALESAHRMDIAEHQHSLGESVEQMLRLAGLAMNDLEIWEDRSAQVRWGDTTPRSLAQVADALGKLASQLQIPPRALWERIPGVTEQDLKKWEKLAAEGDLLGNLAEIVGQVGTDPATANGGLDDTPPVVANAAQANGAAVDA